MILSVGLFKFDGDRYDPRSKVILSESIASEEKYNRYLEKAIRELDIKYFKDGGEIRKKDIQVVVQEIEMLIIWVNKNVTGNDLVYLNERLINMRKVIPKALNEDEDVLCIF